MDFLVASEPFLDGFQELGDHLLIWYQCGGSNDIFPVGMPCFPFRRMCFQGFSPYDLSVNDITLLSGNTCCRHGGEAVVAIQDPLPQKHKERISTTTGNFLFWAPSDVVEVKLPCGAVEVEESFSS